MEDTVNVESEYGQCSVCGLYGEMSVVIDHYNRNHILSEEDDATETCVVGGDQEQDEDLEEANNIKWTDKTIRLLLTLYQEHLHLFKSAKKTNKSVWQIISKKINDKGYQFTSDQCDLKFRNLKKTYKRIKDNNNQSGRDHKTWLYFQYFEELFGNDADVNPACVVGNLSTNEAMPSSSESSRCSSRTENTIDSPVEILTTTPTTSSRKRKISYNEEPEWAKQLRLQQATRHEEKMSLFKELIQVLREQSNKE